MKTTVVNMKDDFYDVYIGRGSQWGNPFKIGKDGTREEVIEKYQEYLKGNPKLVEEAKKELKGKKLGCYCKPLLCHGDVLVELIEGEPSNNNTRGYNVEACVEGMSKLSFSELKDLARYFEVPTKRSKSEMFREIIFSVNAEDLDEYLMGLVEKE